METQFTENLGTLDRWLRAVVGLTLTVVPTQIIVPSPAMIASLCLLAVYPLMTALIGWDPIVAATTSATSIYKKFSQPTRQPSRVAHA